jgi:hypothetical protein
MKGTSFPMVNVKNVSTFVLLVMLQSVLVVWKMQFNLETLANVFKSIIILLQDVPSALVDAVVVLQVFVRLAKVDFI